MPLVKNGVFPPEVSGEVISLVRGGSALAKLSGQKPLAFSGTDVFTFSLSGEAEIVGEAESKTGQDASLDSVTIKPLKFVYGFRASEEFLYADDEYRTNVLESSGPEMSKKFARALDIAAIKGLNPKTAAASELVGANNFDAVITQEVEATASPNADLKAALALVQGSDYSISGAAFTPAELTAIAQETTSDGHPIHPGLGLGINVTEIGGLKVAAETSVGFGSSTTAGAKNGIGDVGDFESYFRWGTAKEIPYKIIEYGSPDGGADLAQKNQIYIRAEVWYGWAIFVADAFARIKRTVPSA
jgi:HK97 family phage major capsid protein